jgi:hypothetical protein
MMINPYSEYCGAYGGGADDCVERRGRTGGSTVRPLRLGEPHRRALCGPHATEEKSVIYARRCRVLLHTLRRLGNHLLEEVVDDDDDPFFLVKRLVVFFHMVAALSLTNIYIRGFQPVTRHTNIIWSMNFEWK